MYQVAVSAEDASARSERALYALDVHIESRCFAEETNEPLGFPLLPPGAQLVCGVESGAAERFFVCESLADMRRLYAEHGHVLLGLRWYLGRRPLLVPVGEGVA